MRANVYQSKFADCHFTEVQNTFHCTPDTIMSKHFRRTLTFTMDICYRVICTFTTVPKTHNYTSSTYTSAIALPFNRQPLHTHGHQRQMALTCKNICIAILDAVFSELGSNGGLSETEGLEQLGEREEDMA